MAEERTGSSGSSGSGKKSTAPRKKSTSSSSRTRRSSDAPRAAAPKRPSGPEVARTAAAQLAELIGKAPEGVIGLHRDDDGWTVELEVCEVRRVPDTTDVLSAYEVQTDTDGDLQGYRRVRRYVRGTPGDD